MHPREKARLYHDLGELIASGVTLPRAVDKLSQHTSGGIRRTLQGVAARLARGESLAESIAGQRGINELDAALFTATERAGKLERGFSLASDYYEALAEARTRILQKVAYPLFVLHFAVVTWGITKLVSGGMDEMWRTMIIGVAAIWGGIIAVWLVVAGVRLQATRNAALDRSLGWIPLIGGMRRDLALSRFSAAYDMQLEAGVNVFGALEASGRASASASMREAAARAVVDVRSGEPVSTALVATKTFPQRFLRAFMVGEESGRLEEELRKVSEEYRVGGFRKLEILSEWIPRLVFVGVAIVVAWSAVSSMSAYYRNIPAMVEKM